MRRRPRELIAVFALLLLAPVTHAQDTKAQAEALFKEGLALMAQGKYADACPKLDASDRLDSGLGTKLRLADCRERNGELATAWAGFSECASIAGVRKDPREKVARDRVVMLEKKLSHVTVHVTDAAIDGLQVIIGTVPVSRASFETAVPFDGGEYDVLARAPGRVTFKTTIKVAPERDNVEVRIPSLDKSSAPAATSALVAETPPPPPPPKPAEAPWPSGRQTVGLVVGGVGLVSLAVSGIFALSARSRYGTRSSHCDSANLCDSEGLDIIDQAKNKARFGTIFGAVGLVGVAAGVTIYMTAPSRSETATEVRIAPAVSQDGAGVTARGSF